MKRVFLIILTICSLNIYSSSDFKYQDFSNKSQSLAKALISEFRYSGYEEFYQSYSEVFLANQVFVKGESRFMVKIGLRANKEYQNKFISLDNGEVLNFEVGKRPISIYFENIAKVEKLQIAKSLKQFISQQLQSGRFHRKYSILDLIIPKAQATECENQLEELVNIDELKAPIDRFNHDYLMTQASGCVQKALSAAWARTGGLIEDTGKGLWNFIKSPVKSAKSFWSKAVDTYKTTKDFISNIDEKLKGLGQALGDLSVESQVQLVCSLVGNLGTSVLLNVITKGPLGLANAMTSLATISKRINSSAKFLKLVDQLKEAGKLGKDKAQSLMDKLISTKNEEGLAKVNTLSSANMANLSVEYAACAL